MGEFKFNPAPFIPFRDLEAIRRGRTGSMRREPWPNWTTGLADRYPAALALAERGDEGDQPTLARDLQMIGLNEMIWWRRRCWKITFSVFIAVAND